ncbi:MAG: hypothetical protein NZ902_04735 [Acidilobaceae archaeon]|nr:hypothetical protein [Acidilobaceae archaeon]MCX8165875.1 hypothetical protein [Acidilobaceae archaeon]
MKHKCIMCGRPFPEGQGIVLSKGSVALRFHSSRCAAKFFKIFLDRAGSSSLEEMEKLAKEMEKKLEEMAVKKRI